MLDKEFVPYQESLELKGLEFDEPCLARYNVPQELILSGCYSDSSIIHLLVTQNDVCEAHVLAPTFSQAFRWFRKKYDLVHRIDRDGGWWVCTILNLYDEEDQGTIEIYLENCYPDSYEDAELACLRKLIEIVKK